MLQIGTGARTAVESNRPRNEGKARAVAVAAPLVEGTRFAAPARPLRMFFFEPSTIPWLAVYAWTVFMTALRSPIRRPMIRGDAVGRATATREDGAVFFIIDVDAKNDRGDIVVHGRRRQDDAFRAGIQVLGEVLPLIELPRAFEHDIDLEVAPWKPRRVSFHERRKGPVRHHQRAVSNRDPIRIAAVDGVMIQQVSQVLGRMHIIDRDHIEFRIRRQDFEGRPSDPSQTIEGNFHQPLPPLIIDLPDEPIGIRPQPVGAPPAAFSPPVRGAPHRMLP